MAVLAVVAEAEAVVLDKTLALEFQDKEIMEAQDLLRHRNMVLAVAAGLLLLAMLVQDLMGAMVALVRHQA